MSSPTVCLAAGVGAWAFSAWLLCPRTSFLKVKAEAAQNQPLEQPREKKSRLKPSPTGCDMSFFTAAPAVLAARSSGNP